MPGTYTYDPMLPTDKDKMRFELGDALVSETDASDGSKCVVSDEEIMAILSLNSESWSNAKLALLDAICNRLAYEVTVYVGDMSLELGKRAWHFKQLRDEFAAELRRNHATSYPRWNSSSMDNASDGGHYFRRNAHSDPNVSVFDGAGEL